MSQGGLGTTRRSVFLDDNSEQSNNNSQQHHQSMNAIPQRFTGYHNRSSSYENNIFTEDSNTDDEYGIFAGNSPQSSRTTPRNTPNQPSSDLNATNNYEPIVDEIPLLEELGIDFKKIWQKSLFALNPFSRKRRQKLESNNTMDEISWLDDNDLTGPLFYCLLLGFLLLFKGKVQFGYIYGFGFVGCISFYVLLNLMHADGIQIQKTISILGYSLLPIVIMAIGNIFVPLVFSFALLSEASMMVSISRTVLPWLFVAWSTWSATGMFVTVLKMHGRTLLLAYPIGLVYVLFALITIF